MILEIGWTDEVRAAWWEFNGQTLNDALEEVTWLPSFGRMSPVSGVVLCEALIELTHDRIDLENELDRKASLMRIQQRQIGLQARENRRLRGEVARLKRALRWKHDEAVEMGWEIERLREAGS